MKSKVSSSKPDADLARWCEVLSCKVAEPVPPGWRTTRELCKALGKSETRIREMLRGSIEAGRCERKEFNVVAAGTVRPVPHYKLK